MDLLMCCPEWCQNSAHQSHATQPCSASVFLWKMGRFLGGHVKCYCCFQVCSLLENNCNCCKCYQVCSLLLQRLYLSDRGRHLFIYARVNLMHYLPKLWLWSVVTKATIELFRCILTRWRYTWGFALKLQEDAQGKAIVSSSKCRKCNVVSA